MLATLIMGGGPGGTGPLVWAAQNGLLSEWLDQGIAIIDRTAAIGGTIGRYIINSDSLGAAYLECLAPPPAHQFFGALRDAPVTRAIERMREGFPPLGLVGEYLGQLGACIEQALAQNPRSAFLPFSEIRSLHLRGDGAVAAEILVAEKARRVEARTAIMALGGRQIVADAHALELLPSVTLRDVAPEKVILSDTFFTLEGLARAQQILAATPRRRVVILGGRHSAFSSAWLLTTQWPQGFFGADDITILCRRTAPIFYGSRAEAVADGWSVTERNICPNTGRVNRFSGIRGDGRDMWRRIAHCPGTEKETRVRILRLSDPELSPAILRRLLDDAALVIPALGYRAATVPIFDPHGKRLSLSADQDGPAVGRDARLLLASGQSLPQVFGIGLGTGYQPWGHMGGEADLEGQTNSLWLYQNHIGAVVYRGVQECLAASSVSPLYRSPALDDAAAAGQ